MLEYNVVEVLEALQLLVSTDLFVAVVAIDPRYVCLSLEERRYIKILHRKKSPTAMDFLKNIFKFHIGYFASCNETQSFVVLDVVSNHERFIGCRTATKHQTHVSRETSGSITTSMGQE